MAEYSKPTSLGIIWADGGDKIKPSDDKIQTGWLPEIPTRQNFNWLDNRQDQFNAHVNQHGIAVWDQYTPYVAMKSYTQGSDSIIYRAKQDNLAVDPVSDTTNVYWEQAFVTADGYFGGKRFVGYESFSSDLLAVVNHRYFLTSPATIIMPVDAVQGDAVVVAKRSDIVVVVGGFTLQSEDEATFVYDNGAWIKISSSVDDENSVTLSGAVLVTQGTTNDYNITNYNSFSQYSVSSSIGTVSRVDDVISLVVPNPTVATQINLTVTRDGTTSLFLVAVGAQSVATPSITYPIEGQTAVELTPTLQGSAFTTIPVGQDTHQSSQWQVATDAGFTDIKFDSGVDTVNKTGVAIPPAALNISTTYYARVRYTGAIIGVSAWSVVRTFVTTNKYIVTPTVAATNGPDQVDETPTISTSAFTVFGGTDTHTSTDWQIVKVSDSSVVWQSLGNTTNKLSVVVPANLLLESTSYKARARHSGAILGSSAWGEYAFITKDQFFTFTPASAGLAYGGGYYAGANIVVGGVEYAIIVAPKAQGGEGVSDLKWKTSTSTTVGTTSGNDGVTNTNSMMLAGKAQHPAAAFCYDLVINGFDDWYLPAYDELEICYRYLKPSTAPNYVNNFYGVNTSSRPVGAEYTATSPTQTNSEIFRVGGIEAFSSGTYWSSTEIEASRALNFSMSSGLFGHVFKDSAYPVRAIRRVPIPT